MTGVDPATRSAGHEISRERTFGGVGIDVERVIPRIDVGIARDQSAIDDEIWAAARDIGFFQVTNHEIAADLVNDAFAQTAAFFALPEPTKSRRERPDGANSGWEYRSQVRPSTGTADDKESYQITPGDMDGFDLWPSPDELPQFRSTMTRFGEANRALAMRILSTFARKLGFVDEFFEVRHDPESPHHQSTLRLLHYLALDGPPETGEWRAGAHTDFDCLTLLHQVEGQGGLQVCPGADAAAASGEPLAWTDVEPAAGVVTCNIGDMLTRWSDDQLMSTLHRVRMPRPGEPAGPRLSLAYFAQADRDAIIEGPSDRYAPIAAGDFLQQRIAANFAS